MGIRGLAMGILALAGVAAMVPAAAPAQPPETAWGPASGGHSATASPSVAASGTPARMSITSGHPPTRPYPFMAWLRTTQGDKFGACGGTLIAARWVLTAGHCITDDATGGVVGPDRVELVLGKTNVQAQRANPNHPDWRSVAQVIRHPAYSLSGDAVNFDVGLLRLSASASEAQARLPRPADAPLWAPGAPAAVIGFGATIPHGEPTNDLFEADLIMQPDDRCAIADGTLDIATAVCSASGGPPGACHGDSGGPLLVAGGENVLAGAVSLVTDTCSGANNVFARLGSDPINAWIRAIVPQAEIDVSPPAPQPGDTVTVTSAARGPYTSLVWDTDGNGSFGDARGAVGLNRALPTGQYRVGLQASNGAGNRETRYITVDVRPRTPINITEPRPRARVTEGQPVRVTLAPGQAGTGTIAGLATPGSAKAKRDFDPSAFAAPLAFAAGESAKTVLVATRDDYRRERSESFRVSLGSPTGQLLVGNDAARDITIVDDDVVRLAGGKTIRVRRNRARVRLRTRRRGRITVLLERRSRRRVTRLGTARTRLRRKGLVTVRVRLNRRGRRLLRRQHRRRVHVTLVRHRDPVGRPLRRTLRR